jgi:ElaB/YqjD/DUF883 family membrane-anchored ribosome-binding protein
MAETEDVAPSRASSTNGHRPRRSSAATGTTRNSRASRAVEAEADTLEAQVAQLQSDLKSITHTLSRMGQTAGNELKSTASAQAEDLAARGQSAIDYAQDEFGAFEKQIKDTIREKPLTAVAGAIALGFVIAVLTR